MSANSSHVLICPISSLKISAAIAALRTVLTVPLSVSVLHLGRRRWQQQRSFNTTSHSDIFTYHMAGVNLMWVLACSCFFAGIFAHLEVMMIAGLYFVCMFFYGELLLHVLTCVERYLAVVHPVTYLGLRKERGVRIRNISIGCAWLLCVGSTGVTSLFLPYYPNIPVLCFLVVSLTVVSFCSLSVLCVLIVPRPGEGGREKEQVDQAKDRAFHIIAAITVVLWLWFAGLLVSIAMMTSPHLSPSVSCVVLACASCLQLPSTLVLPLLYLHRSGKLPCCCYSNE